MRRVGLIVGAVVLLIAALVVSRVRFVSDDRAAPSTAVASDGLTVPVAGYPRERIADNWGDPREGGMRVHHGTDVMAPGGARVVAVAAGRVEKLFESRLGGTTLYQRSADGRWMFYYAHLAGYAPGVTQGMAVRAGQRLAFVGDTGDAGPGNTHLHFGLQRMAPGERWWEGEDVNPYPYLAGKPLPR